MFNNAFNDIKHLSGLAGFQKAYDLKVSILSGKITQSDDAYYQEATTKKIIPKVEFEYDELSRVMNSIAHEYRKIQWTIEEQLSTEAPVEIEYLYEKKKFPPGTKVDEMWVEFRPIVFKTKMNICFKASIWTIAPPIAVLLLGICINWIVNGFIQTKAQGS